MDTHLNGVVICAAGDLTRDADHSQWTNENMKRWVEARGGKFVDVMSDSVTHLLCSIAAFKANKENVKFAKTIRCKIVTYEWLEDTFLLHDQLKRKAPTGLYDPGKTRPAEEILALYRRKQPKVINKKVQADAEASTASRTKDNVGTTEKENEDSVVLVKSHVSNISGNRRKGTEQPIEYKLSSFVQNTPKASQDDMRNVVEDIHPEIKLENYRIYKDPTDGFPFQVEVSRPDGCGNPRGKRWLLQVFESKATPRRYKFGSAYFEDVGAHSSCSSGVNRPKNLALEEFRDFFSRKTGFKWKERLLKASKQHKGHVFRYHLPAPGEPIGYIHPKYRPGKAEGNKIRDQKDCNTLACDSRVPSLKRKRDGTAESQLVKAT